MNIESDPLVTRCTTGSGEVVNAYGLYLSLPPEAEEHFKTVVARNKTEVLIEARCQTKTFTYDEFFKRLGFE